MAVQFAGSTLPAVICLTGHISLSVTHQWAFLHYSRLFITLIGLIPTQWYKAVLCSLLFTDRTFLIITAVLNRTGILHKLRRWGRIPFGWLGHVRGDVLPRSQTLKIPLLCYSWYHLAGVLFTDLCTGDFLPNGILKWDLAYALSVHWITTLLILVPHPL